MSVPKKKILQSSWRPRLHDQYRFATFAWLKRRIAQGVSAAISQPVGGASLVRRRPAGAAQQAQPTALSTAAAHTDSEENLRATVQPPTPGAALALRIAAVATTHHVPQAQRPVTRACPPPPFLPRFACSARVC